MGGVGLPTIFPAMCVAQNSQPFANGILDFIGVTA
jgi:hypothetical protein